MLVQAFPDEGNIRHVISESGGVNAVLINGRTVHHGKCPGYCREDQHPGYLDSALIRSHQCRSRRCVFFYEVVPDRAADPAASRNTALDGIRRDEEQSIARIRAFHSGDFEELQILSVVGGAVIGSYRVTYTAPYAVDEKKLKEALEKEADARVELIGRPYRF